MNLETNFFDVSFDSKLSNIQGISRLPWVGNIYKTQKIKTLILGESVYDWKPSDPLNFSRISSANNLRNLHINHALNFKKKSKFVRNIERAVYSKRNPTNSEKEKFWNSVCYHNLVGRVLKTKKNRPSHEDYLSGWSVFEALFDLLEFEEVIVYGLENKKIKALIEHCNKKELILEHAKLKDKIGRSHPLTANITKGNRVIKLLFIRHPSSYFSWKKWAPIINSEISYAQTSPELIE
ncbi:MAG: hypothetical protein ACOH2I_15445 [Pseudomonas sp.]